MQNGSVKLAGKGSEVRPSNRIRQDIEKGEEHRGDLQGETDESGEFFNIFDQFSGHVFSGLDVA